MSDTTTRPAVERAQPPDAVFNTLVNPVIRRLLTSRFHAAVSGRVLLLEYRGRRNGRTYRTPAGYREIDGRLALLTNSTEELVDCVERSGLSVVWLDA